MENQTQPGKDAARQGSKAEKKAVHGVKNKAIWPAQDKAVRPADDKGASS